MKLKKITVAYLFEGKDHNYYVFYNHFAGRKNKFDTYKQKFGSSAMNLIGTELPLKLSKEVIKQHEGLPSIYTKET